MAKTLDIISTVRSDNLLDNIKAKYDSVYTFCVEHNEDYSSINKYVNKTLKIGDKLARRFEQLLNLHEGELDEGVPDQQIVKIPIVSSFSDSKFDLDLITQNATQHVQLKASIIKSFGWDKHALIIIMANDDSMSPTIQEGSKAIVDTSQSENIQTNKIYAIKVFNEIHLRRINKSLSTGKYILTPDALTYSPNSRYKEEEISYEDFEVIGKVVMLSEVFL